MTEVEDNERKALPERRARAKERLREFDERIARHREQGETAVADRLAASKIAFQKAAKATGLVD